MGRRGLNVDVNTVMNLCATKWGKFCEKLLASKEGFSLSGVFIMCVCMCLFIHSFSKTSRPALGPTQPPGQRLRGVLCRG